MDSLGRPRPKPPVGWGDVPRSPPAMAGGWLEVVKGAGSWAWDIVGGGGGPEEMFSLSESEEKDHVVGAVAGSRGAGVVVVVVDNEEESPKRKVGAGPVGGVEGVETGCLTGDLGAGEADGALFEGSPSSVTSSTLGCLDEVSVSDISESPSPSWSGSCCPSFFLISRLRYRSSAS